MSQSLGQRLAIPIILIITFCVAFIFATWVFDSWAQANGFYSEGFQADKDMSNGLY